MREIYETKGTVSEIQKFSVHDGPGIRTLVFLKGCPLRCKWCSNPENITVEPQYMVVQGKPKLVGKQMTVEEVMQEVRKDMCYYRRSGGGLTVSGGEPYLQPKFTLALMMACREEGISTAIETSSFTDGKNVELLLPWLDVALCDIKHVDDDKHIRYTGQSNKNILENVRKVGLSKSTKLYIRIPVIPGFNSTEKEIGDITSYAAQIPGVRGIHLLPYHRLGETKYNGLGQEYELKGIEPMSPKEMESLLAVAKKTGLDCQIGG